MLNHTPQTVLKLNSNLRHRGSALVLVMLAVAMACILGLSFLATSSTAIGIARNIDGVAQAEQLAEGGMNIALHYLANSGMTTDLQGDHWLYDEEPMLNGTVSIHIDGSSIEDFAPISISNPSFESTSGSLSNGILGLIAPQLSGTIGDWSVSRKGLGGALTSLTIPRVGVKVSPNSMDGDRIAYATFVAGVAAEAEFSQVLVAVPTALTRYRVSINVGTGGLAVVAADYDVRIEAGGQLLAASTESEFISLLALNTSFKRMVLEFATTDDPPEGPIKISLLSKSTLSVASAVAFDQIQIDSAPLVPLTIRSFGAYGDIERQVVAQVWMSSNSEGRVRVCRWADSSL